MFFLADHDARHTTCGLTDYGCQRLPQEAAALMLLCPGLVHFKRNPVERLMTLNSFKVYSNYTILFSFELSGLNLSLLVHSSTSATKTLPIFSTFAVSQVCLSTFLSLSSLSAQQIRDIDTILCQN